MEADDRGHAITVRAFGVTVAVRASDAALLAKLIARLPPGSQGVNSNETDVRCSVSRHDPEASSDPNGSEPTYVVTGEETRVETTDESEALDLFESAVRFDVAVSATEWLFVHAGVVGWRGHAIVIPAASMQGKSQFVDALVRAGADYYSDEFAVLDRDGCVHPFRIAASLREPAGRARRVVLAASPDPRPLPIAVVVSTRYEAGASWEPRQGTPGEAAMALLANTVRARIAPAETLRVLARAAEGAILLDGPRGEAADTAHRLLDFSASRLSGA